ncbi:MAG: hypothetical protein WAU28_00135 [Candidatus Moraniibacteriota bacterium]
MDVMKAVKNVLSGAFILALIAMIFSSPQVRADGVHGVRETAKEILVEVPKFCRPLKTVWEVRWKQNADNEDVMLGFTHKDNGSKITVGYLRPGALKIDVLWQGGRTVHIPKLDAKGRPIKVEFVSILALGGGDKLMNEKNWTLVAVDGIVMVTSPPVNEGTWGKCS